MTCLCGVVARLQCCLVDHTVTDTKDQGTPSNDLKVSMRPLTSPPSASGFRQDVTNQDNMRLTFLVAEAIFRG